MSETVSTVTESQTSMVLPSGLEQQGFVKTVFSVPQLFAVMLDSSGTIVYASSVFFEKLEYSPLDVVGKSFAMVLRSGDSFPAFLASVDALIQGSGDPLTSVLVTHSGKQGSVVWNASALIAAHNEKYTVLFAMNNPFVERENVSVPAECENMSKMLLDVLPMCVKWFDRKGNLLLVNRFGREEHFLEGKSDEEIRQWNVFDSIEASYRDVFKTKFDAALKGEVSLFEIRHATGMSRNEWCSVQFVPVFDSNGEVENVLYLSRNLTKIKEDEAVHHEAIQKIERTKTALFNILEDVRDSEKNLQKERDRSQAIISSMGEGLLVLNEECEVILANQHAGTMLRVTPEEISGKNITNVFSVYQSNQPFNLIQHIRQVIGTKDIARFGVDSKLVCSTNNGGHLPVEVLVSPFVGEDVSGAIVIFNDITEERSLDDAKSNFISIASHQLRTPLTSMRWFSEMLIEGDAGEINDDQRHFIERIYQGVDRMVKLVNLLLQIARVEAGRIRINSTPLDLKKVTEEIIESLLTSQEYKKQLFKVVTVPENGLPMIPLDKEVIWQIVQNLLTNALRYSPDSSTVTVTITQKGETLEFAVADQGIGIPKDQQNEIFKKFFRATNASKSVPEGSGLGLSLVKSLVDGWGGKVWFESEENKGTTFIFTIPLAGVESRAGEVGLAT